MRIIALFVVLTSVVLDARAGEDLDRQLLKAARGGKVAVVSELLEDGADVYAVDKKGRTAGALAASKGHSQVLTLLRNVAFDVATRADTIPAYERFLLEYSGGNHDEAARTRVMTIRAAQVEAERRRQEAQERLLSEQRRKISEYQVGVLTRDEFRSGWHFTANDQLGIVAIRGNGTAITYFIGTSDLENHINRGGGDAKKVIARETSFIESIEAVALQGESVVQERDYVNVVCGLSFSISDEQTLVSNSCE